MESIGRLADKFRQTEPIQLQTLVNEDDEENYMKSPKQRSSTDIGFLVLHAVLLVVLVFVIGYSVIVGDIDRLTKGYDDCGNICGKENNFDIQLQMDCKAEDMTDKPYLYVHYSHRQCVESCNTTDASGYICISDEVEAAEVREVQEFIRGFSKCLYNSLPEIVGLTAIALVFAFCVLLLLRYFTAIFIWFSLIGVTALFVLAAVFYGNESAAGVDAADSIRTTILYSICALTMIFVLFALRKRIELLIQLFKEAGKSIISMPILLFQPVLTFIALAIIWSAWLYCMLWIESAGTPKELFKIVTFEKTTFMYLAELYNVFIMLWMIQFVCGCQNMIVAGAVSTWYFARNKCQLGTPIYSSAKNMIRFHLGTISVSSLIIAIMQFVKILVLLLRRTLRFATCITYCLNYVEQWMRYYTKNACIITAIHGHPFREAGSRAFQLITTNLIQIVTINACGDFVLMLAKIIVAASSAGIAHLILKDKPLMNEYELGVLLAIALMGYMIAHCFFSIYEAAVDTIFVCFCEDREINDGLSRPYFMSTELMEFVEKSKKIIITINAPPRTAATA